MKTFRLRDILAIPFLLLSVCFEWIAIKLGGRWTAETIMEGVRIQYEAVAKETVSGDSTKRITDYLSKLKKSL